MFQENKTSDGRSIGRSIHDSPQEIQTDMLWAAHVKKESLDGAAQNPADTCCPSDNKSHLPAPGLCCEFISYSNYIEAPKKTLTMLTNPWAPTSV